MCKVNLVDYVEKIDEVDDWNDELYPELIDGDYITFEKIKPKKHHFKEGRNFEKLRDKMKNHRISRSDKKI